MLLFNSRMIKYTFAKIGGRYPMQSMSPDTKNICPVCKKGRLSKNISTSFLGLVKRTYVECNNCKAAFFKIEDKYCLDEIKDTSYPNWQRYNHQVLTVREWNTIAQGGYSDQEHKQIDIEMWLQQLSSGAVTITPKIHSIIVLNPNEQFVYEIPDVIFSVSRTIGVSSSTHRDSFIRLAREGTWRMGGFKAKSESHEKLTNIDTGILTVTNKRLIFAGAVKKLSIDLKKIISIESYDDGISLSKEGTGSPGYFTNIDKEKVTLSVQGRKYEIPMDGLILKILIEREI